MKPLNLGEMRKRLIGEMAVRQGSLQRTVIRMKDDREQQADILDQAVTEQDRTLELTIRFRESQQIRQIQEAIRRIDHGGFGVCDHCGQAIAPKRLILAPLSRLCTICKAKLEAGRDWRGYGSRTVMEDHAA